MKRLDLFPISTRIVNDSLTIAGQDLASLADLYRTPLYVYDSATLNFLAQTYTDALSAHYPSTGSPVPAALAQAGRRPASAGITYAGKAFLCKAIAQWTQQHGFHLDCTGEGEIGIAVAAGVPRGKILVHGVNKSEGDLKAALQHASVIVVDNLDELHRIHVTLSRAKSLSIGAKILRGVYPERSRRAQGDIDLWLRLLPGVTVTTHHAHTQTGHHESKFGMTREEILEAAEYCRKHNLPLKGIHFHQGSNFRNPEPLLPAIEMALDLAKEVGFSGEWHFCPGGGWSVAYHEDELPHPSIESYVRGIAEAIVEGCHSRGLDLPRLHLEPGRSLVARAGVAIYRVGAVKKRGDKTWLLTDGGMADNPRYALYGARYSCLTVSGPGGESGVLTGEAVSKQSERVSIAGPYCESGDIVIEDLPMPKVKEGDLIAIPVAGAYHLSMSSNYNGARRPAVLMLDENGAREILRRETIEDILSKDTWRSDNYM